LFLLLLFTLDFPHHFHCGIFSRLCLLGGGLIFSPGLFSGGAGGLLYILLWIFVPLE